MASRRPQGPGRRQRQAFYEAKLATARFYFARVLPQTTSLNHQIKAGAATVMALPAEEF